VPRKRGPHSSDASVPVAVRLPNDMASAVFGAAGATGGPSLSEWLRNVIRRALGRRLDYDAGYEEGKAAGWADANARFRAALKESQ